MKKYFSMLLFYLVLLACLAVILQFWNIRRQTTWRDCRPYDEVRTATARVKLGDVKHIELESPFRFPSVIVTDKTTQELLLKGLQGALMPPQNYKYRVDHAYIILKSGKRFGPFGFSTRREVDAFSPSFVKGLRKAGIRIPTKHDT